MKRLLHSYILDNFFCLFFSLTPCASTALAPMRSSSQTRRGTYLDEQEGAPRLVPLARAGFCLLHAQTLTSYTPRFLPLTRPDPHVLRAQVPTARAQRLLVHWVFTPKHFIIHKHSRCRAYCIYTARTGNLAGRRVFLTPALHYSYIHKTHTPAANVYILTALIQSSSPNWRHQTGHLRRVVF